MMTVHSLTFSWTIWASSSSDSGSEANSRIAETVIAVLSASAGSTKDSPPIESDEILDNREDISTYDSCMGLGKEYLKGEC